MFSWGLAFFVIATIAAIFGFVGSAASAAGLRRSFLSSRSSWRSSAS
jgi:uncharacterized membrane protein YtjA (UPF0391 family)